MSLLDEITVICPRCGLSKHVGVFRSINATNDPNLKQLLLEGRLNWQTCESCGNGFQLIADLLYHDIPKTFMVSLDDPARDVRQLSTRKELTPFVRDYVLRIVGSHAQFVEKIRILEDGLDDTAVELLKLTALTSATRALGGLRRGAIFYNGHSSSKLNFLVRDEHGVILSETEIPFPDAYAQSQKQLASRGHRPTTGEWLTINIDHVIALWFRRPAGLPASPMSMYWT